MKNFFLKMWLFMRLNLQIIPSSGLWHRMFWYKLSHVSEELTQELEIVATF
jgi:hypothetical protein